VLFYLQFQNILDGMTFLKIMKWNHGSSLMHIFDPGLCIYGKIWMNLLIEFWSALYDFTIINVSEHIVSIQYFGLLYI
jgi:hypothetical protein